MDKKIIIFSLLFVFLMCSCNKPEWVKTLDGNFLYTKTKSKYAYSWEGQTIGKLSHGEGCLTISKDDKIVERRNIVANYGAIGEYEFINTKLGNFLGSVKKDMPNEFGLLINEDTLKLGMFKKGKLYEGNVQIYYKDGDVYSPYYIGEIKKEKPTNIGELYENGMLIYSGFWKKGDRHGIGKEYKNDTLVYEGWFSKNKRNGTGKEYINGKLLYDGDWNDGKYSGYGTLYTATGLIKYCGEWKNGLYDGKGKLYENGQCIDAKWDCGRNVKMYSTSFVKQVERSTKLIVGREIEVDTDEFDDMNIPQNQQEFISMLYSELDEYLTQEFEERVKRRFNIVNIPRMCIQPILRNGIKRSDKAQDFFIKKVSSEEMQNLINAKIDYYNSNCIDNTLKYIYLRDIPKTSIVDENVAKIIFDRESMESIDLLIDIFVYVVVCIIIAFIIGFIIGLFFPNLIPICGVIDAAMALIAFVLSIIISIKTTGQLSSEMENELVPKLVD